MMTTRSVRKLATPAAQPDTVSIDVVELFAVFWEGEHCAGTLHNVAAEVAAYWIRRGWATPHNTPDT